MSSVIKTCRSCLSGPFTPLVVVADSVLVGLHPFAREAPDAVGHDYQRGFEAQRFSGFSGFDTGYPACRRPHEMRGPDPGAEMGAGGGRTLEEPGVGLLAPYDVTPGTVQGRGNPLAQVGCVSVYGESRELAVMRLVEPVGQAHQCYLRGGMRHEAVATGLVPGELLPVDEQCVQPRLRGVVGY